MKSVTSLLALLVFAPTAFAQVSPFVGGSFGMNLMDLQVGKFEGMEEEPDWDFEVDDGTHWTVSGGAALPLSPAFSAEAQVGYTQLQYTSTLSLVESDFAGLGIAIDMSAPIEIRTTLLDLGFGARWHATSALSVGAAVAYSMVLSSEFDAETRSTVSYYEGGSKTTESSSESYSGDYADIGNDENLEGFESSAEDFLSIRGDVQFRVYQGLSLEASFLAPLGDHLEGSTLHGSAMRAGLGARWTFGQL